MTTTPTIWKAEYTANAGFTAGPQASPVAIGLADGRLLSVWADAADNIGSDFGNDIIGRFHDAQGNTFPGAFQLNRTNFDDDEIFPAIAALPDGGFVVVYLIDGTDHSGNAAVCFDRYDAGGARTGGGTIASGTLGGVENYAPSIAVFANGDFVVSYTQLSGGDYNVVAKIVDGATNAIGPALNAGQNSIDLDADPDTVVLSNGNILTVYHEADSGVNGVEAQNITSAGSSLGVRQNPGTDPHAAALTGGGYVVVFRDAANNGDIIAEIRDNAQGVVTDNFLVQGGINIQGFPDVVALKDGGFFVAWYDDTTDLLRGQRFSATGTVIGTTLTIAANAVVTSPALGLADDGRILVTFGNAAGDISQVILDPRDNVISGDSTGETIMSRIDGATVNGNGGNDTLLGQAAADVLIGGTGADLLRGGGGNDIYYVDNAGDTVSEIGGSGIDTVVSSINFSLADAARAMGAVEHLTMADLAAARAGTGNNLANVITGNKFDNALNGGAAADLLKGGLGNDTYYVDNAGDKVSEIGGSGSDTVISSISFSLADATRAIGAVEKLTMADLAAARAGTGNNLGNVITGNKFDNALNGGAAADLLKGGAGSDTYYVDNAGDKVSEIGGTGSDTVVSAINFSLADAARAMGAVENLTMADIAAARTGTGNNLANAITGNKFNNTLNGGGAADLLKGGGGSDTYYVDNAGDMVSEIGGTGNDMVVSAINFSLANAAKVGGIIENLTMADAAAARTATGNNLANAITGNKFDNALSGGAAADLLKGGGGSDTLVGERGVDRLAGGAGNDFFVFNAPLGVAHRDVVIDFGNSAGNNDTFRLDNAVMPALGGAGALNPAFFRVGPAALDADDHVIYNNATGGLLYDSNGNAAGGLTQLATLTNKPTLSARDFVVI